MSNLYVSLTRYAMRLITRRMVTLNTQTINDITDRLNSSLYSSPQWIHPTTKEAAVMIPLCLINSVPSILFTVRSDTLKNHSGEVRYDLYSFYHFMHQVFPVVIKNMKNL